jgi:hypothetical protein
MSSKRKAPEREESAKRRGTVWLISQVSVGEDDAQAKYTNMCYADSEKARDSLLFLYDKLHTTIKALNTALPAATPYRYQRMTAEALQKIDSLQTIVPPKAPVVTRQILHILVDAWKGKKMPVIYLAAMYAWDEAERRIFVKLLLEEIGAGSTFALSARHVDGDFGACEFANEFSEEQMALIWFQLETGFVFVEEEKLENYTLEHRAFPHVPPEFVTYVSNYIDYDASKSHDFWCFEEKDIKAAMKKWFETARENKQFI